MSEPRFIELKLAGSKEKVTIQIKNIESLEQREKVSYRLIKEKTKVYLTSGKDYKVQESIDEIEKLIQDGHREDQKTNGKNQVIG